MRSFYFFLFSLYLSLFLTGCEEKKVSEDPDVSVKIEKSETAVKEKSSVKDISLQEAANYFASVATYAFANYVESVTYQKLLDGALEGMLSHLDPHSSFLSAQEFEELKEQSNGQYAGLGIEVTVEEGALKIVAPLDDSPAAKAGLQAGDLIVRIDQKPTYNLSLSQMIDLLKGKLDTDVELTVRREGKEDFRVKVRRKLVQTASVKSKFFDNILFLRISTFDSTTTSKVRQEIEKAKKEHASSLQGILIDLRNNAGGLFEEAVTLSNLFLREGTIASIRTRQSKEVQIIKAKEESYTPLADDLAIAILINGGTASSSEIFAGALQDHHRAIILGTPSFGKGSIQTVVPLDNGSAIKLTMALYYTPSGTSIQKNGIKPDITITQEYQIEETHEESLELHESDFENAISGSPIEEDSSKEMSSQGDIQTATDYQLSRALDILQGIIHTKKHTKEKFNEISKCKLAAQEA